MSITLSNSITWFAIQYQLTNMQTLLEEIGDIQQVLLIDVISQYSSRYSIDTATGIWLDYVGYRYGVFTRPVIAGELEFEYFGFAGSGGTGFDQAAFAVSVDNDLPIDDERFRKFLKAKAPQLITNCTTDDIRNALLQFFEEVIVVDNQDMSMTVKISTNEPVTIVQSVINAGIITKPAAVLLHYQVSVVDHFGFSGTDGTGFDQASFIYTG